MGRAFLVGPEHLRRCRIYASSGISRKEGEPMPEAARHDPFPSTRWSRVIAAGDRRNPEWRTDLDQLARAYWRPIQLWLQGFCGAGAGDAADLTQDFFVQAIEQGTVGKADPGRGRFRAFLKASLRNFAIDRLRREQAQKRGGSVEVIALHDAGSEPASAVAGPDRALDDAWREVLLQRALGALEQQLTAEGKAAQYRVFADYFLQAEPDLDYAALAARHGISTTAVGNHLMACKRRFRSLLREAVTETVGSEQGLAEELDWLFAGVKGAP
jgi:RNA polymerase sigma-70 factor (ECF subfamily)